MSSAAQGLAAELVASPTRSSPGPRPLALADHGAPVEVSEAHGRQELDLFFRLPHRLYASDPLYVPPHEPSLRLLHDPARSPFLAGVEQRLFLARRDGRVVGRVAAFFEPGVSPAAWPRRFGLFECERDPAAASALFAAVARAFPTAAPEPAIGPIQIATHLECGLLVESDGRPPKLLTPYHPSWYQELFSVAGLAAETDLLAYRLDRPQGLAEIAPILARLARRGHYRVRPVDKRRKRAELRSCGELYDRSWRGNRGFVPLTAAGREHLVKEFAAILDPRLAQVGECGGQPVGFSLALPDINPILRAIAGLPALLALPVALWMQLFRRPRAARLLALGLLPEHRQTGLGAWLAAETLRAAWQHGYDEVELSWILADNHDVHSYLARMGARVCRRHRLYRLPTSGPAPP